MLIRAAIGDDPVQSRAAAAALRSAELIAVTNTALCEFVWVLARGYKRSAGDISTAIRHLLAAQNVSADRPAIAAGLAFLEAGGDFADGILIYEGQKSGGEVLVSFDRKALAIAGSRGLKATLP